MSAAAPIDVEAAVVPQGQGQEPEGLPQEEVASLQSDQVLPERIGDGQYLYWMMVFNNPSSIVGGEGLGKLLADHEGIKAEQVVWQIEVGKNGTRHVQAWVKTKVKRRLTTMKNYLRAGSLRGWVMPCRDNAAARKYCEKTDTRVEGPWYFGTKPGEKVKVKGQRTDIESAARILVDGGSIKDVIQEAPGMFVKYSTGLMKLEAFLVRPRNWMTELHILWGVSGSGKSHTAREEAGDNAYYLPVPKKGAALWWDGYQGEEHVVIEDFYGEIDLHEMLKLVDKYPKKVQVKGAMVEFRAKKVWITSNSNWELWYATEFMKVSEHKYAFERRITSVREFSKRYTGNDMMVQEPDEEVDLTQWRAGMVFDEMGRPVQAPTVMLNDKPIDDPLQFESVVQGQRATELSPSEIDFLKDILPEERAEALRYLREQ